MLSQLEYLVLSGIALKQPSSSGSSDGSSPFKSANFPSLEVLRLENCCPASFGPGMCQLAGLSTLQHLALRLPPALGTSAAGTAAAAADSADSTAAAAAAAAVSAGLGTTLGQLQQLISLELAAHPQQPLTGAALAAASSFSRLQQLHLNCIGTSEHPVMLCDLPDSLAELHVTSGNTSSDGCSSSSSSSSSGRISGWQPSAMHSLSLQDTVYQPGALRHMSQLQEFDCRSCPGLHLAELLPELQHLRQLRRLILTDIEGRASAADYAALTASTHLTCLAIAGCDMAAAAAAQHMFTPQRRLPKLVELDVSADIDNTTAAQLERWSLDAADLLRMAACCPAAQDIRCLRLQEGIEADALLPLLQLTALTVLQVSGQGCTDAVAEHALSLLTGAVILSTSSVLHAAVESAHKQCTARCRKVFNKQHNLGVCCRFLMCIWQCLLRKLGRNMHAVSCTINWLHQHVDRVIHACAVSGVKQEQGLQHSVNGTSSQLYCPSEVTAKWELTLVVCCNGRRCGGA
jgi:hypothetical protein